MGQINCSICSGLEKDKEHKIEVDFRDDFMNKKSHQSQFSELPPSSILDLDKSKLEEQGLVKIQALWRGYKVRKFHPLRSKKLKYFDQTNEKQTRPLNHKGKEERDPFRFKNGAVYTGQWVGELREGFGVQVWPDGAQYKGSWYNNKADGFGKFFHVDGDKFEGNWKLIKLMAKDYTFI